eukprot:1010835-Amphidinium_carterae.1
MMLCLALFNCALTRARDCEGFFRPIGKTFPVLHPFKNIAPLQSFKAKIQSVRAQKFETITEVGRYNACFHGVLAMFDCTPSKKAHFSGVSCNDRSHFFKTVFNYCFWQRLFVVSLWLGSASGGGYNVLPPKLNAVWNECQFFWQWHGSMHP